MLENQSYGPASSYAVHHREKGRDFRRALFRRQLELLAKISPAWRDRCARRLNEILAHAPFDDGGPEGPL